MEQANTGTPATAGTHPARGQGTVHRCTTPDGQTLALTQLEPTPEASPLGPVVLVHGSYTHRRFWVTADGFGLAPFLADNGFDVWIPELRGHGLSPKGDGFGGFTAEDHIRRDLPTVHETVREHAGAPPTWIGHSSGGLYLLGALSRAWIDPDDVRAVALFGTQISHGEAYLKLPLVAPAVKAAIDLIGYFPAPRLGMGPEIEPPGEMEEMIDWKAQDRWVDRSGVSYRDGLADLQMPIKGYAGAGDTTDPPEGCRALLEAIGSGRETFQLLSKDEGFARDYGHAEMIASKAAAEDVWPDLLDWLIEHA